MPCSRAVTLVSTRSTKHVLCSRRPKGERRSSLGIGWRGCRFTPDLGIARGGLPFFASPPASKTRVRLTRSDEPLAANAGRIQRKAYVSQRRVWVEAV